MAFGLRTLPCLVFRRFLRLSCSDHQIVSFCRCCSGSSHRLLNRSFHSNWNQLCASKQDSVESKGDNHATASKTFDEQADHESSERLMHTQHSENYNYFRNLSKLNDVREFEIQTDLTDGKQSVIGALQSSEENYKQTNVFSDFSEKVVEPQTHPDGCSSKTVDIESEIDFRDEESGLTVHKPKKQFEPSYNLAAYVNQSETLSKLVKLGVDLSEVEKVQGAADLVIKLSFEREVKPYLFFLHDIGMGDKDLGHYLSKNPLIFKESVEDLEVRINYMRSKNFSNEAIARIVTKAHVFLLMKTTQVDAKLGYLQKDFRLTGDEVRFVATRLPKIITWNLHKLKDNKFYIKEFLGFSEPEMKQMLLALPKLYVTNKHSLGKKFDYLYNVMGMTHECLVQWPSIFRTRLHTIQQRHKFLLSIGRAQYDQKKENYVSLKALAVGRDQDFCRDVAKVSVAQFNDFLKTL